MFTGLIQNVGTLADRTREGDAGRLVIRADSLGEPAQPGESIAVEGVCLTVAGVEGDRLQFDVLAETFRRTNLGSKPVGARMNLERALPASGRLGGHIVNGHVDGVGEVRHLRPAGRDWVLAIICPNDLLQGVVFKGCIACNGVSLTIASLRDDGFDMHLIPETMKRTSLAELHTGDPVNLEIDVVGKYVRHFIQAGELPPAVTWDALREHGLAD